MKRNFLWIGMMLLALTVVSASCRHKQHLEVNKSLIVFSFAGGSDVFSVEGNCDWTIDTVDMGRWLTVSPLEGASGEVNVGVSAERNDTGADRNTSFEVVSADGKIRREVVVAQSKYDISVVVEKVWFLRTYERWDTDFWNHAIPESYRSWIYYADPDEEQWFFYFQADYTGTQVHVQNRDTTYYPYTFEYFPEGDSLNIVFGNDTQGSDDYHAIIHELNPSNFSFSDPYRPHQYEKLNMVNVSVKSRTALKVNPKRVAPKPAGPLIPVE